MALLSTGPAGAQTEGNISWSPDLHLARTEEIPHRLREPLLEPSTHLQLTSGQATRDVADCDDYLKAVSAGFYPPNNYEAKMSSYFVHDCFVLRDLQRARPSNSSTSYRWTGNSLSHLPPLLVPGAREVTDEAEQAQKRGESWKQFNPALRIVKIKGDLLLAEDADYAYSLEILARADFNGDSVPDIAVYGTAQGKHSTWSHDEYLVLSVTAHGKLVRLTQDRPPYDIQRSIAPSVSDGAK